MDVFSDMVGEKKYIICSWKLEPFLGKNHDSIRIVGVPLHTLLYKKYGMKFCFYSCTGITSIPCDHKPSFSLDSRDSLFQGGREKSAVAQLKAHTVVSDTVVEVHEACG